MTLIPRFLRTLAAVIAVLLYVVTPGAADQAAQSAAVTCFTPDIKIVCGEVPGTYVVTLMANASNGAAPTEASVNLLTPGVTIVNSKPVYQVGASGQIQLVVSGALPGDTLDFEVNGSRPDPQSELGFNVCCSGKVTITIPKHIKCGDKDIVDLAIEKSGATTPSPAGNGYAFTLAVTNKGSAFTGANAITVKDTVPAGMTFTAASGINWACATLPAAAGVTMTCIYTGAGPAAGQALPPITIAAKANGKPPYPGFKNCAKVGPLQDAAIVDSNPANNKSCVVIDKPKKFDVSIDKSCAPASLHKVALGPAITGLAFTANCKIKVTSTGDVTSPISVSEALTAAGGSITSLSANPSTDPWACSPALPSAGPLNCTLPANTLTGPTDSSEIDVTVQFPPTGDHTTAQNCARLSVADKPAGKSCVDIPHEIQSSRTINKVCEPATQVVGAINHYESKCHITVNTTGPQTGTLQVHDNMNGAGTITTMSTSTSPAWSCTVPDCSINGSALNQTASTSVIDVNVSFATQGHVTEGQNCAIAGVDGKPVTEKTCVPFTTVINPPQQSKIDISKTCSAYTQLTATGPWVAQCAVTVTAIGSPLPPVIGFAENMTYSGSASPIGISAMSSSEPWSCNTVPANANTPVNCTLASSSLPSNGSSTVNFTVSLPQGVAAGEAKNCAQAQGLDAGGQPLAPPLQSQQACVDLPGTKSVTVDEQARISISKQVMYNGTAIAMPGVAFPVTASCDASVTSVATDQPASTVNLAPGTGCTITEGVMPAAAVSLGEQRCAAPMTPKWTASYAPSQTVSASPGVTVAITNTLTCEPGSTKPPNSMNIEKSCNPPVSSPIGGYDVTCTLTVDLVADPLPNVVTVRDYLSPYSNITSSQTVSVYSADGWSIPALPVSPGQNVEMTISGSSFPASGQSQIVVGQHFGALTELNAFQNCVYGLAGQSPWNGDYGTPNICVNFSAPASQKIETNPPAAKPACDRGTTKLVGKECRCTVRGMVPVSKTACGCPDGTQLKNGECHKVVVPPPPPPKDPVCSKSQRLQNHKCVDIPPPPPPPCGANERRNAAGKCVAIIPDCPRGAKWNGKRCVDVIPDCASGTHWNGKRCMPDVPDCPQGTVFNGKRCVPKVVQCEPGQIRIGKRCIDQPRCARGQIALPGTGICVDLKPRGDKPRDPKPGPVYVPNDTGGCVPLPGKPCR